MKGRPKSIRKISFMPAVSGFRPYGGNTSQSKRESIYLYYEEYESLRLSDYEHHTQCESAVIMGVSRPTFTRIYQSAREKIAKAFVEGLRIIIEGGKVQLDGDWYVCSHCGALFSTENQSDTCCALCGSSDTAPYEIGDIAEADTRQSVAGNSIRLDTSVGQSVAQAPRRTCARRGCHRRPCKE